MSACTVCDHATEHGWLGQPGAHCRHCHRSWTSTAQAHCVLCHEQFATNGVADRHWRQPEGIRGAPSRHVHPSEVPGLNRYDESHGPVWRSGPARQAPRITPRGRSQRAASAVGGEFSDDLGGPGGRLARGSAR